MIDKVELGSVNRQKYRYPQVKAPQFGNGGSFIVGAIQSLERNPMANVAFLDCTTAIGPRTIAETTVGSKQTDDDGNVTSVTKASKDFGPGGKGERPDGKGKTDGNERPDGNSKADGNAQ